MTTKCNRNAKEEEDSNGKTGEIQIKTEGQLIVLYHCQFVSFDKCTRVI